MSELRAAIHAAAEALAEQVDAFRERAYFIDVDEATEHLHTAACAMWDAVSALDPEGGE